MQVQKFWHPKLPKTNNPNRSPVRKIWFGLFVFGAADETWTHTSVDTRPSNVPVCLFQHCRTYWIWSGFPHRLIIISNGIAIVNPFMKIFLYFDCVPNCDIKWGIAENKIGAAATEDFAWRIVFWMFNKRKKNKSVTKQVNRNLQNHVYMLC